MKIDIRVIFEMRLLDKIYVWMVVWLRERP